MSLFAYTLVSIPVIAAFIVANYAYALPWWASIGLAYSLVLCVKGVL